MHTYSYIYIYTCLPIYLPIPTYPPTCMYRPTCIHAYINTYTRIHTYIHICIHTSSPPHTHTYRHTHLHLPPTHPHAVTCAYVVVSGHVHPHPAGVPGNPGHPQRRARGGGPGPRPARRHGGRQILLRHPASFVPHRQPHLLRLSNHQGIIIHFSRVWYHTVGRGFLTLPPWTPSWTPLFLLVDLRIRWTVPLLKNPGSAPESCTT